MAFCKEFFKAPTLKQYPQPSLMTPEEKKDERRAWWETGVDDTLEQVASSIRMHRLFFALIVVILLLK